LSINELDTDRKGARSFMSGVLLLSLSTVAVKIIGLAFKIPMLAFLGTKGMGYFNSAYEIYALLCVISTAGLPVALSMLVSAARARGDAYGVARIYRTASVTFFVLGAFTSAFMLLFSKQLAELIGNPDAYLCIAAIAPALLAICLGSAVRGYCQGFEYMTPTAISQLIEALGKLGFGIILAGFAIRRGYEIWVVSAFSVLGVTLGSFISLIYLSFAKHSKKLKRERALLDVNTDSKTNCFAELIRIAVPITLGSALISATRIADMTLIMRRLQEIGVSAEESNRIYGAYTTLAVPVFSLIPALIAPVSMALVPQLAAYIQRKRRDGEKTVIENATRLTLLLAMPASMGLVLFSRPILELLFSGQSEAIILCAPLLSVLGGSVLFSCLITTTNAILQSYKHAGLPIVSMAAGLLVKIVSTYILVGNRDIGVMGAPIGSFLCNITVTLINFLFMHRVTQSELSPSILFKPFIASAISVGAAFALYSYLQNITDSLIVSFGTAVAVAIGLYALFCFLTGSVSTEDIVLLPFGERIVKHKDAKVKK